MNTIPVYVQLPNRPQTLREVGDVPHYYTLAEVRDKFRIDDEDFVHGKLTRTMGKRRWVIVSLMVPLSRSVR
jgi:hypothetical protein